MNASFSALPSFVSLLFAVVVTIGVAFGINALVRRYARRWAILEGSPLIGVWAGATTSLCALLFTFTIITLWNAETRAAANVDAEALAIRSVGRDMPMSQLPLLDRYVQASVSEWPALCGGGDFAGSQRALEALAHGASPKQREYEDDLFRQLSSLELLRAQRIRGSGSGVPSELWFALMAMSLAMFAVLAFGLMDHPRYLAALTCIFGGAVGILFWLAGLLDFPFCGGTSVSPQPLIDALHFLRAP